MTTAVRQRAWPFPRRLLVEHIAFGGLLWIGLLIVVMAIVGVVSAFRTISISGWDEFATIIPRWYVGGVSGYIVYQTMPAYIAFGETRRSFAARFALFSVIFSLVAALLITVGYVVERIVYSVMDWNQEVGESHLYASATELPLIFLEYGLVFLAWGAGGAFIAAAFYRSDGLGLLSIPVVIIVGTVAYLVMGADEGQPAVIVRRLFFDPAEPPLAVSILGTIACYALLMGLTWPIVRDIPIRTKAE